MKKEKILLLSIILLAVILRFYALDKIPIGFIPEEVSTGWNAYSLLKTGRDEWGTFLPLIFRETGGYKLALNSYLIVPVMAILGATEFAVRTPTALAGVLSVLLTYLVARELFKSEKIALAAAFMLAVCPWAIAMGRYAVDVNFGIPLFLLALLMYLKSRTHPKLLIPSAISFGLTYYTYFNYDVFTTLFLGLLFLLTWKFQLSGMRRKYSLIFAGIVFLFLLPYIVSPTLSTRFSQATSVSQIGFTNRINEHRQACEWKYPASLCRIAYNKVTDKALELSRNYINHFSTSTYFLHGSKMGLSGMPDYWGLLYPIEFIFLISGIVTLIKKKLYTREVLLWAGLALIPSSLAAEGHIWRMLTILPLPQLIEGIGIVALIKIIRPKFITTLTCAVLLAIFVSRFWLDYTAYFPFWQARYSYFGFKEAYQKLEPLAQKYDAVLVSPPGLGFDQLYIYYAFFTRLDPTVLQQERDVIRTAGSEGWVSVSKIGKWYFVSDPRNGIDKLPYKSLILTDETQKPYRYPQEKLIYQGIVLERIAYPNGDGAFVIIELTKNPVPELPL